MQWQRSKVDTFRLSLIRCNLVLADSNNRDLVASDALVSSGLGTKAKRFAYGGHPCQMKAAVHGSSLDFIVRVCNVSRNVRL